MRASRQPLFDGAFLRLAIEQRFVRLAAVTIDLLSLHLPLLRNLRFQLVVIVPGRNVGLALIAFDATVTERGIFIIGQCGQLGI
jgi:hypothetical protein